MRSALLLVAALQLVTFKPPAQRAVWVIGLDGSTSVNAKSFAAYPALVRTAVLPLVRPGDTIVLLRLDHPSDGRRRSSDGPETIVLDPRLSHFTTQVTSFYERVRREQQARGPHQTDIGQVFDYVRRSVELDRHLNTASAPSYVIVCVTDGLADGRQTVSKTAQPSVGDVGYRIVFLGVNASTEPVLRGMAAKEGFDQGDRALIVPITHVKQLAPSLARFIGRPVNPGLAQSLERAASREQAKAR
jgi:hypothetical protein